MRYYRADRRGKTLSDWPTMLLTFVFSLVCWGVGYFDSIGFPLTGKSAVLPFWGILCDFFNYRIAGYITGLLLLLLTAFVMQRISDVEMLIRERTRLPFMLFVLFISANAGLLPLKEVMVVLLCLVFMIYELFKSYQQPEATGTLFNAGLFIGFAALFMPQVLWFVPLLWVGMYQFRSLSFRSLMASLVGVLMVYWFALAWCTWKHDFTLFTSLFASLGNFKILGFATTFQHYQMGVVGIILILIMALFHVKMDAFSNSVRVRQMLFFLLNMSIWTLFLMCLYGGEMDSFLAILCLPGSVLIAYFLENIRGHFRFVLYFFILVFCLVSFALRVWNF